MPQRHARHHAFSPHFSVSQASSLAQEIEDIFPNLVI